MSQGITGDKVAVCLEPLPKDTAQRLNEDAYVAPSRARNKESLAFHMSKERALDLKPAFELGPAPHVKSELYRLDCRWGYTLTVVDAACVCMRLPRPGGELSQWRQDRLRELGGGDEECTREGRWRASILRTRKQFRDRDLPRPPPLPVALAAARILGAPRAPRRDLPAADVDVAGPPADGARGASPALAPPAPAPAPPAPTQTASGVVVGAMLVLCGGCFAGAMRRVLCGCYALDAMRVLRGGCYADAMLVLLRILLGGCCAGAVRRVLCVGCWVLCAGCCMDPERRVLRVLCGGCHAGAVWRVLCGCYAMGTMRILCGRCYGAMRALCGGCYAHCAKSLNEFGILWIQQPVRCRVIRNPRFWNPTVARNPGSAFSGFRGLNSGFRSLRLLCFSKVLCRCHPPLYLGLIWVSVCGFRSPAFDFRSFKFFGWPTCPLMRAACPRRRRSYFFAPVVVPPVISPSGLQGYLGN